MNILNSPKNWNWSVSSTKLCMYFQNDHVNEVLITTTPTKLRNNICTPSSSTYYKVLTPTDTYRLVNERSLCPTVLFDPSPTISEVTPTTKSWISELINLPSTEKKSLKSNIDTQCPNTLFDENCLLKKKYKH